MTDRFSRREILRRTGALGLGLPLVSTLLAACSPSTAVAPTSPATVGAAPTVPAATKAPAAAATTAPATAAPAAIVAPAPAPTAAASTKSKAIISITQEPTSLDPTADATASIATTLRDNVFEGLVRLDAGGKILGSLARSWDVSPDGTVFTFHLVSGAKWHDGSPFTAQDVKFSWDRAGDAGTDPVNPHRDYWAPVKSTDVVDDATVKVTLNAYSDNWLFHMASGSACIVSSKSAATNRTNPVGTGPFKFGAWNRGANLSLTRSDDYWGSKARLKDVEFRFITDPNAVNNALKAGDIDAIGQVTANDQVAVFQLDPAFTVVKGQPAGKVMISVNNSAGPLADKRVRQALYAAIDRKAHIDGYYAGLAQPIGSHAVPNDGEPYYADLTATNPYDPNKARQLLAAAGQSNLKLRLAQISAFPYAVTMSDILASQLQAVGVTLDVMPMEFPRWLQTVFLNNQDYDLTIINHVEQRDIGNYANPKYYWRYDNADVTDWLTRADAEPDEAKRNALYKQVQQQLADDAVNLWICAPETYAMGITVSAMKNYSVFGISPSLYLADTYFA